MSTTGRELAAFWARCEPGTRLTCVANTYWQAQVRKSPQLAENSPVGNTFTVRRIRASHLDIADGAEYLQTLTKPRRVSDVIELTEDTITFRLDRDGEARLAGHTATWRIEK